MKINVFVSWIVGNCVLLSGSTATVAAVEGIVRRGLQAPTEDSSIVIFNGSGRIEKTDDGIVIKDGYDNEYEVPGGTFPVDVTDEGLFQIYGDDVIIYGSPLGMILNKTDEAVITNSLTGTEFIVPDAIIDLSNPDGSWSIIGQDGRAMYGNWNGSVVIDSDGTITLVDDAGAGADAGTFVITDIDGGGCTITGVGISLTLTGSNDGDAYIIQNSDGTSAAYGGPDGMLVQYPDYATLYNFQEWTHFDINGGVIAFGLDNSWSVVGNTMTVLSDAEGNVTFEVSTGNGGGVSSSADDSDSDNDSTTSTTTEEGNKDEGEEEAASDSSSTTVTTTDGDDEKEKEDDGSSNSSVLCPCNTLFVVVAFTTIILA